MIPAHAVLLLLTCVLVACGCQQSQPKQLPRLRILTYNIHHGEGMDKRIDLPRIADVINAADPDLVALQEVSKGMRKTLGVDQAAELGRLTGYHAQFGRALDYDGGEFGQAILSRWPIELSIHVLPFDTAEPRNAIEARVRPADERLGEVRFVSVHVEHRVEELRLRQVRDAMAKIPPDCILAGDFNAEPGSQVMNEVLQRWDDTTGAAALSFPAIEPVKKIDWILVPKGGRWRVVSARVIDEPMASDHRPVVVEIEKR